jgi:hypothetical protein
MSLSVYVLRVRCRIIGREIAAAKRQASKVKSRASFG